MTTTANAENLRQYKIRFYLIVEQILAFVQNPVMVRGVKNLSPNLKQIVSRCFTLLNILIGTVRSIFLRNSKQFH